MPLVEDVISQLGKSAWFTTLDLQSGFWQIRMAPEDMGKTALVTKSGLFEWTVMPFDSRMSQVPLRGLCLRYSRIWGLHS